jgi:hypothetical protein
MKKHMLKDIRYTCVCSRTWKYMRQYYMSSLKNTSKHDPHIRRRRRLTEPEAESSHGRTAKKQGNVLQKAAIPQAITGTTLSTSNLCMD